MSSRLPWWRSILHKLAALRSQFICVCSKRCGGCFAERHYIISASSNIYGSMRHCGDRGSYSGALRSRSIPACSMQRGSNRGRASGVIYFLGYSGCFGLTLFWLLDTPVNRVSTYNMPLLKYKRLVLSLPTALSRLIRTRSSPNKFELSGLCCSFNVFHTKVVGSFIIKAILWMADSLTVTWQALSIQTCLSLYLLINKYFIITI